MDEKTFNRLMLYRRLPFGARPPHQRWPRSQLQMIQMFFQKNNDSFPCGVLPIPPQYFEDLFPPVLNIIE